MLSKSDKEWLARNKKISDSKIGRKNPMWKGDEVGYFALHEWIANRLKKPKFCQRCYEAKPEDLANISGKYLRTIEDFEWLCRRCHMEKDGRLFRRNTHGQFAGKGCGHDYLEL